MLLHTDAVMERDDAWISVFLGFPGIWGYTGGGGEMAGLFVHCGIMSSAQLQDTELAVTGNISCQPQKLGFFSLRYIAGRGWSQRCLGYFLLLSARVEGKTQL